MRYLLLYFLRFFKYCYGWLQVVFGIVTASLGVFLAFWYLAQTERFLGVPWLEVGKQFLEEQSNMMLNGTLPPVILLRVPPSDNKCVNRSEELTHLYELFNSFNASTTASGDKVVYTVYLMGPPGLGKEELSRQFGKLVHGHHRNTVITLNCESEEKFKDDLIKSVHELKAYRTYKGANTECKEYSAERIQGLMSEFRKLLQARLGWLLIVNNIRDPNITHTSFYKELPQPGSDKWGQGYMLVTTQVHLRREGPFVKLKKINRGMNPNDAKQLLCELVAGGKGGCTNDQEAGSLVEKLEFLPLAIVVAGNFINQMSGIITSYTLGTFVTRFEEENGKAEKYYDRLGLKEGEGKCSLQTALRMAFKKHLEHDTGGVLKDVCAFLGSSENLEVPYHVLKNYLEKKGHDEVDVLMLIHFPLMEYGNLLEHLKESDVCPTGNLLEHLKESDVCPLELS